MIVFNLSFCILLSSCISSVFSLIKIKITPPELNEFRTGQIRNVTVTIFEKISRNESSLIQQPIIQCQDQKICEVRSIENIFTEYENKTMLHVYNVTIEAIFLGITQLDFSLYDNETVLSDDYVIRVMRAAFYVYLTTVFTAFIGTFIIIVTFMMGTQLEWAKIRSVMQKPVGPAIGFVCQFVLMPLFGFCLAEFGFNEDETVLKLALFAASTCPGGGKSSFWTIIYGGNLDLSVAMTFTQTISAIFMMPFWLYTLGKRFTTKRIEIPFFAIIEGLLVLMIPSSAGMYFIHRRPHLVKRVEKQIKRCTWFATVFFTAFAIWANWYVFLLFTWKTAIIGCLLPWAGYFIAYTAAWVCGQSYQNKITIAIETGVQNIGIATILMIWSLPEPEVDISLTILFAIMISTDKPLIILWLILKFRRKYCGNESIDDKVIGKYKVENDIVEVVTPTQHVNEAFETTEDSSEDKQKNVL
ncbi:unnamed protein product [Auanema sp. JU1783]|nr:unnamed protein product [Auanema sp. JU1783]